MKPKFRLTKLSDDIFEGNHPNGIDKGYVKEGIQIHPLTPKKDECFYLDGLRTSLVTEEMNEDGIFKTMNSTYKLETL